MALIRFNERQLPRNPWAELEKMRHEMEMMLPRYFGNTQTASNATVYPALNISEDESNIYVRAEVPGTKKEELEIFIEGDTLTIKGERRDHAAGEKISYHRQEISYGRFNRAVTMPTRIDSGKIKATGKNGILTIVLPKSEETKPRRITIEAN